MNANRRSHLRLLSGVVTLGLFSAPVVGKPKKTMDEHAFWQIVEAAKASAADLDARPQSLEVKLNALDLGALSAFQRGYESFLLLANRWDLWGAAYLMNGAALTMDLSIFETGSSQKAKAITTKRSLIRTHSRLILYVLILSLSHLDMRPQKYSREKAVAS